MCYFLFTVMIIFQEEEEGAVLFFFISFGFHPKERGLLEEKFVAKINALTILI